MIKEGQRLHKGDLLRNDWAGENNPQKITMYIGRGKIGSNETIKALSHDGRVVHHCKKDNRLVVVGHLFAYDAFVEALSRITELR